MDPRPIGVFDSGVGGLTVLHECLVTMPNEDFVYLGDHARLPYGPRPLDEIRRYALEIGGYLQEQGVKLILVACNAATSAGLAELQSELDVPVVGVITPEAREAAETLARKGIENAESREGSYRFLTTGDPEQFREMGARFLQLPIDEVEQVTLADLARAAA